MKWLKVLENKEKMTVDKLIELKLKNEKKQKREKDQRKKMNETFEDRVSFH